MPATTSPLMALRFSGRLMVIQNALLRFSSSTLFPSVISCSFYLLSANINGRKTDDCKDDLRGRSSGRLLHPDLVVVKGRSPVRRDRLGAGEHVDAATAAMGLVRVDRFRDQHASAHAFEQSRGQNRLAAWIAQGHRVPIGDAQRCRIHW